MPTSIWIGLLLCNIIWSANPAVSKLIVMETGPQHAAWLKYFVALMTYTAAFFLIRFFRVSPRRIASSAFMWPKKRMDLILVMLIGAATCFVSPLAQMFGLSLSTVINNALIVTFEPLLTALLGWLILGERLRRSHYFSFTLAIGGFMMLSHITLHPLGTDPENRCFINIGDIVLLVAVAGEATYSVLARKLTKTYYASAIFGTSMLAGVILLSLVILPWKGLPAFAGLSLRCWIAVLWLSIIGTTIPYLYWLHALNRTLSIGSVVLSLFLQPLIGSAAGFLFLGEQVTVHQLAGGAMIVGAVAIQWVAGDRPDLKQPLPRH